jgi:hypothetical protein
MLLRNSGLLISVTFSTPTPVYNSYLSPPDYPSGSRRRMLENTAEVVECGC